MVGRQLTQLVQEIALILLAVYTGRWPGKNGWHLAAERKTNLEEKQFRAVRQKQQNDSGIVGDGLQTGYFF